MRLALLGMVLVGGLVWLGRPPSAEAVEMSKPPFAYRVRVPPLPENVAWLNTSAPLELDDLRGKFVLLDFWTYCCINCMHILPELKKLEQAYPKNLVVIGVHSAKFQTEQDSRNIAEAILRYRIEHPVLNDPEHAVWDRFQVSAWPTVVLIDPEGYAVWETSGEITFEQVNPIIRGALPYYRQKGLLDESPVRFDLEARRAPPGPLRFPGKVLADEPGGRLFIADSNHHRIVVTRLDGTLLGTIGSGASGRADGDFASAQFNQPQGMALRGEALYIADTENHLVRKADLAARTVTTVAGVGEQARRPAVLRMADPKRTPLSSPWDLCIEGDFLYIAMAGTHQIWRMRLDGSAIGPYAGNGREDIVDGPLVPREPYELGSASFAQPSGLSSDGTWLYVADSEGSSIRAVPFNPRQEVRTVVGTSGLLRARLFTFGDRDGPREQALFQHPLGVAWYEGRLYVADTYNNKIKVVDPQTGQTQTLAGSGKPGRDDLPPAFDEPAGISAAAGKLFVADTNNHLIRVVDLRAGNKVSTLSIPGLEPPKPPEKPKGKSAFEGAVRRELKPAAVRADQGKLRLHVLLELPPGYKLNPNAPMGYLVSAVSDGAASPGPVKREALDQITRLEKPSADFEIALPLDAPAGRQTLEVGLGYYWCRENGRGLCRAGSVVWTVPVELSPGATQAAIRLEHEIK